MSVQIINGDCRAALEFMPSNSVDSVVTDPPYALVSISKRFGSDTAAPTRDGDVYSRSSRGFMGKTWDNGSTAFDPAFWADVRRVLKPGGHVLAFGGTRTYHRLACAIEDGGFEIRDQIGWLYGSGFPKSHNQTGDWAGWGTALKPAWEPIVVARKALDGTNAQNLARWGVGALNIDGCRVATTENLNGGAYQANPSERHDGDENWRFKNGGRSGLVGDEREGAAAGMFQPGKTAATGYVQPTGRWPANVIHDGSDDVLAAFPAKSSVTGKRTERSREAKVEGTAWLANNHKSVEHLDSGSPARFFYAAKASKTDRGEGNTHPTVKPTDLMRYLPRLVTPPGGVVLDPFMGSGSTGRGAVLEGFSFIGIELELEYVAIARARIAAVQGVFA